MKLFIFSIIVIVSSAATADELSKFELHLESGALWQNRNDTKITPQTGTRVPIDSLESNPFFHYRSEFFYNINPKHSFRLVYAPLVVVSRGSFSKQINFDNTNFAPNENLSIRYQFNSYRLSYIHSFRNENHDKLRLGITLKVRDAFTEFNQSSRSSKYSNVGVVPLIYFEYQKPLARFLLLNFAFDAAVSSQGRASDVSLKIRHFLNQKTSLGLGIRSLEGGADNVRVFTFSWFTYAVVELVVKL